MNKNEVKTYRDLAESYDEKRYVTESHNFLDQFRERTFNHLLEPTMDMSIIDVGTGTGSGIVYFSGKVKKMVGLDGTQEMLDIAQGKIDKLGAGNVTLVCSNALEIPYEDNSFDHLISLNFIHLFVPDGLDVQKKFIAEMERVVKPGGAVIIEFDNILYLNELGNAYDDIFSFGNNLKVEKVVGTYMPKTLALSKLSKPLAYLFGGLARYNPFKRFAYKWVVKYTKNL